MVGTPAVLPSPPPVFVMLPPSTAEEEEASPFARTLDCTAKASSTESLPVLISTSMIALPAARTTTVTDSRATPACIANESASESSCCSLTSFTSIEVSSVMATVKSSMKPPGDCGGSGGCIGAPGGSEGGRTMESSICAIKDAPIPAMNEPTAGHIGSQSLPEVRRCRNQSVSKSVTFVPLMTTAAPSDRLLRRLG